MDFPGLIGPSYTGFSLKSECQRTMNLYLERVESGAGRGQLALIGQHGLQLFTTATSFTKFICRGLFELNDHLFDIQDDFIYDIDSSGAIIATYVGLSNDGKLCSMAATPNSLFVVSNSILYRIFGAALSAPVTPTPVSAVAVLKGQVFVLADDTSRQIYFSNDDGATWAALDFQTAEAGPNALINMIEDHNELWVFGNRLTQVFVLGDDPDAPLVEVQAGIIEMGIAAKNAVAKLDNSLFWMGKNKDGDHMVYRANGYTPVRVSNHAVENAFRTYPDHENAIMQAYQLNGHSCLRLTFPSANGGLGATWEYDASMNNWTEVAHWNTATGLFERHRGNCYASAFGKILVGDYANGALYEMSPDFHSDYGYLLGWERRAPHVTKDNKRIQYKRFEVVAQTGVGGTTAQWLNDYSLDAATFTTNLNAQVAAGNVTIQQALVMQLMYDRDTFSPSVVLPDDSIMTPLGFYEWGRNPQIGMRYSNDGANTWTNYTYRNLGRAGEYSRRLYWNALGIGRDRVWELSGDAPVKTAIVQGTFEAEVCNY